MARFGVRGKGRETLERLRGAGLPGITWTGGSAALDALVLLPGSHMRSPARVPVIVAPGECDADAAQIITYGLGSRDTLTYSSMDADGPVLSLQRELVTLEGLRLERQEIPLPPLNTEPETALAIAGALLTAGLPPSSLAQVFTAPPDPQKAGGRRSH